MSACTPTCSPRWTGRSCSCTTSRSSTWPRAGVSGFEALLRWQHPGLVGDVADALHASGLAPSRLTLEITESLLVQDTSGTTVKLQAVKDLGVRLALDDFGTGYSSLSYLRRFPIDS